MKKLNHVISVLCLCLVFSGCRDVPVAQPSGAPYEINPIQFDIPLSKTVNFAHYAYDGRGGVIVTGTEFVKQANGNGYGVACVSRFLPDGSRAWKFTLADLGYSDFTDASVGNDGIYACGWRGKAELGLIARFSLDGKLLWERETRLGENENTGVRFDRCCQSLDGGVIAAASMIRYGEEGSTGAGNDLLTLTKFSSDGTLAWHREYDLAGDSDAISLLQAQDGIYVSCPSCLLKTDADGKELWDTRFLESETYYTVDGMAECGGRMLLSCAGDYTGKFEPSGKLTGFQAQFERNGKNPSALILIDRNGNIKNITKFYGAFGCCGGPLFKSQNGYIQGVLRIDDIVPSLPSMNVSTMPKGKTVLLSYDSEGNATGKLVLDDAAWTLIGAEGDRPVVLREK